MSINIEQFKAELIVPPVKIEHMFFAASSFYFYPVQDTDEKAKLTNIQISFDAKITGIDEAKKMVQIQVTLKSVPDEDKKLEFNVMCIGVYTWLDDTFDEKAVKSLYQWGASIQTSAIREHIMAQTSRGPYNVPSYIPVGLIHIKTEVST